MKVLEAHNLKKTYGSRGKRVEAVRDVSLTIAAGEVLAFLGPNGAGKTTTIKMMAGLIQPDAGEVRIGGSNPHRDPKALRRLGAVLEGNRNLYWRLTPDENLDYFGVLKGLTSRQVRQRKGELLERFGLISKRRSPVQSLSRGMQQKLAIAVALIHEPQLLLLDEPTLGLDVEATENVKVLVRKIAAEGRAILLTTHQLGIAEELSDRIAIIQSGEIIAQSTTRDLIQQFSGTAYKIELEEIITSEQIIKLERLGVAMVGDRIVHVNQQELLYSVLDILRPLPLVKIEKEQADLTEIFLKLVTDKKSRFD